MKSQIEKVMEKFNKYLEEHGKNEGELTQEEIREMIDMFNKDKDYEYDEQFQKEIESDEYLEKAYMEYDDKKAIKYCNKALELNPNNLDAEVQLATLKAKDLFSLMSSYEKLIEKETKRLEKEKYFAEDVGHFYSILETRPYMRLRLRYVDSLIEAGMLKKAIEEAKDMIRLNEGDNLGMRYKLAHMYSHYEMEEELLNLHKQYGEYPGTQFLLPLSILYFKKFDLKKAEKYLIELNKENKDTKKFFKGFVEQDMPYIDFEIEYGYRPDTIEELAIEMNENSYLFITNPYYFIWGYEILKKKR